MAEIFFSLDVESDGPIPGVNSMYSLGAAAFMVEPVSRSLDTFSVNLEECPGASADHETMAWWTKTPQNRRALEAARFDQRPIAESMQRFVNWVRFVCERNGQNRVPAKPVAIAYPAGYDWTFVYWYMRRFVGESPFGFTCLDIKTYAMVLLGTTYGSTTKDRMPRAWLDPTHLHSHIAVEDAMEQGKLFCRMYETAKEMRTLANAVHRSRSEAMAK